MTRSNEVTQMVVPDGERSPAVEVAGVSKRFRAAGAGARLRQRLGRSAARRDDGRVALHPLDLTVPRGQVVGVLGVNGSGKSTLVRVLSTLLVPDTGTARVFGHDVVARPEAVRRHINRVSVDAAFFKELSPWENLLYSARLYDAAEDLRARAADALERMSMPPRALDRPMKQLSRGQQQKVAIARSLLTSPSLLLMDEPTTGLDPRSKREVQGCIRELHADRGVTVVLCTHDLDEAEALCERVVVLHDGRLLADGSPQELRRRVPGAGSLEDVFLALTGRSLDEDPDAAEAELAEPVAGAPS
jgi:ABC-2 type transport system ATP-binding protein